MSDTPDIEPLDHVVCECGHDAGWHECIDGDLGECLYGHCECAQFTEAA